MVSRFWLVFCPPLFSIRKYHEFYCFLENSFSQFYVLPFVYLLSKIRDNLTMESRLTWNSPCSCLSFPSAGFTDWWICTHSLLPWTTFKGTFLPQLKPQFSSSLWGRSSLTFHLFFLTPSCLIFIPPISLWIQFLMSVFLVMSLGATHWMETSQEQKPYLLFIAISLGLRKIAGI